MMKPQSISFLVGPLSALLLLLLSAPAVQAAGHPVATIPHRLLAGGDDQCADQERKEFFHIDEGYGVDTNADKRCHWVGENPQAHCDLSATKLMPDGKSVTAAVREFCPATCGDCDNNNNGGDAVDVVAESSSSSSSATTVSTDEPQQEQPQEEDGICGDEPKYDIFRIVEEYASTDRRCHWVSEDPADRCDLTAVHKTEDGTEITKPVRHFCAGTCGDCDGDNVAGAAPSTSAADSSSSSPAKKFFGVLGIMLLVGGVAFGGFVAYQKGYIQVPKSMATAVSRTGRSYKAQTNLSPAAADMI